MQCGIKVMNLRMCAQLEKTHIRMNTRSSFHIPSDLPRYAEALWASLCLSFAQNCPAPTDSPARIRATHSSAAYQCSPELHCNGEVY